MEQAAHFLEIAMLLAFGFSWPNNIIKTYRNKSTKGKSIAFLILVDCGYICGIVAKILAGNPVWYVLFFYILNFTMVTIDMSLYFHYRKIEKASGNA
ncbi:MAG: hypothetical protein J5793_04515 [Clostridia bacterium]|nr:hypothetical protein [Clostridia bacterium]